MVNDHLPSPIPPDPVACFVHSDLMHCRGFVTPASQMLIAQSPAFAQGFAQGQQLCQQQDEDHWHLPTDIEFTALISQYFPNKLPLSEHNGWRQGFVFGWVLAYYHGSLHHDGFCDDTDAPVQRIHLLGRWTSVEEQVRQYGLQFADRLNIELVEWGKGEKQGHAFILLEWWGNATEGFEMFLERFHHDPAIEEIIVYEVPAPRCTGCLPRAQMISPLSISSSQKGVCPA